MTMSQFKYFAKITGIMIVLMLFAGCSLKMTITEPAVSSIDYGIQNAATKTLTIIDKRSGLDSTYVVGKLGPIGEVKEIPVSLENVADPVGYFARNLEKEFISRKVPMKCVVGNTAADGLTLEIIRYQIINRRATGFSPWEAMHVFEGILMGDGRKSSIKAYFYNGKMPVWTMSEIEDPCFNIPISIIIKDVASKINQAVFNYSAPDEKVDRLSAEIESQRDKDGNPPFWKILELGYTNNQKAMEPLKKYAQQGYEFIKSCALSAIGVLGANGQFEFLKQRYTEGGYNDRYLAIKAIGDIGSPEAIQFIREIRKMSAYENEWGVKCCVDLYAP
jgi:hypothetical protein